ncbi:MAG: hypothetical protein LBJ67_07700 [Planctomycetaceae bacterium]|jgi:hypothetical protein|nr:hypothetical protein [Planctomycetaceae bacterium]
MSRIFAAILFATLLLNGCKSNVPEGFPAIVPCTVTVTDSDKPLADVFVVMETVPPTANISSAAKTDAQGKAVMQTSQGNFSKEGVPVGKLVMTLAKTPGVEDWKSQDELQKMTMEESMAYFNEKATRSAKLPAIIPKILTDSKNSPLTKDAVAASPIDWSVNVAEFKK